MTHRIDYLIIGGGIAGTTAAETIRRRDSEGSITILNKEPHILYSRVLLPKYVQKKVTREQVFLRTLDMYERQNISVFVGEEAIALDIQRKEVKTNHGNIFLYKKLLIAVGGEVKPWSVAGEDLAQPFRLQTIDDAKRIRQVSVGDNVKEALLIGGGFIGLEFINSLTPQEFIVHMLLKEKRYWAPVLDEEGSAFIERHLEKEGVRIYRNRQIAKIAQKETNMFIAEIAGEKEIPFSILAVGIGIRRNLTVFKGIGIDTHHGIKTNEFLETSVDSIWAAGDIAEFFNIIYEKYELVGNWTHAFMQGRVAGENMASALLQDKDRLPFLQVSSYAIEVLGMHIAFLGDVSQESSQEAFSRSQDQSFYEQFMARDGKLVGAVLCNKFSDKKVLEQLIKARASIESLRVYKDNPSKPLSAIL